MSTPDEHDRASIPWTQPVYTQEVKTEKVRRARARVGDYFNERHKRADPGEALYGWSEIAAYMGCTMAQCQRWCDRYRMPVVRTIAKRVFTTRNAIDQWVKELSDAERRISAQLRAEGKEQGEKGE